MEEQNMPYPYEFINVDAEEDALIKTLYDPNPMKYVRVGPKGYVVCKPFMKDAENIYNMPLRPSDVFVTSYQRSGTTWTQELVWLLVNNLDYEKAAAVPLAQRYAFLDCFMFFDKSTADIVVKSIAADSKNPNTKAIKQLLDFLAEPVSEKLATEPSPRFVKTHLPLSLLPPTLLDTVKVVYVARDPRDVAVSSYHHSKLFKFMRFPRGFKDFWDIFHKNLFVLTPYFEHVKEAWEKRDHPNMLFLFFEELKKDLPSAVRRISDFLGKQLDEEQMSRLCKHLSIDNFKNNKSVNHEELRELGALADEETFIRTGKAGGWRDYFDEEMTQQAEQWIADNLRDTDLRFPHMQ